MKLLVSLGLCLSMLGICSLRAEPYYPVYIDDSDRVELRGSLRTDISLKVVDGSQNLDSAIVQVFECHSPWRICSFLTEAERQSDDTYRMQIPRSHLALRLRIFAKELGVISMVLPEIHAGEIDLGTVDFRKWPDLEDIRHSSVFELEGVVVDEQGEPLEGIRVRNFGPHGGPSDRSFLATYTDAEGKFNVWQSGSTARVSLYGLDGNRFDLYDGMPNVDQEASGLFRISLETAEEIDIVTRGKHLAKVAFSLYSLFPYSNKKIPIATLKRRLKSSETSTPSWLLAQTDGHLSRLVRYTSQGSPMRVDFSRDKQISIKVTSGGKPIDGAAIHVVEVAPGYRSLSEILEDRNQEIDRLASGEDGQVDVLGDPGTSYVAVVEAAGFSPRASMLSLRTTNEVELDPINPRVELKGVQAGETIKLKVAGTDQVTSYCRQSDDKSSKILKLAPGKYDVTVASKQGEVDRGTTVKIGKQPTSIDLETDDRPELKLDLPVLPAIPERIRRYSSRIPDEDVWVAIITRDMPWGGVSGALAISYYGQPVPALQDPPLQLEIPSGGEGSIRLHGVGRWFVQLGSRYSSLNYWLLNELEISAGETRELSIPPLTAGLVGNVDFYKEISEYFFHHGIANPRLMMLPQSGFAGEWSMVLASLNDDKNDPGRIELDHLVPGEYRLEHFLNKNANGNWGGYRVKLREGEVNDVGNLSRADANSVRIDVVNERGERVTGALLSIKNRMYDAWDRFTELPTTGVYAGFPLDKPPSIVLQGKTVAFDGVQQGLLELMVEDPLGIKHYYLVDIPKSRRVRLVLP